MDFKEFIGIDVSKLKLDVCIHSTQQTKIVENTKGGYKEMVKWIKKNSKFQMKDAIFIFESTGVYSNLLGELCDKDNHAFVIVSGLEIKRSTGIVRGKTDATDAKRIALYGYRRRGELTPTRLPSRDLVKIKKLQAIRDQFVKQRTAIKTSIKETQIILAQIKDKQAVKTQQAVINLLNKEIKNLEKKILDCIKDNPELNRLYALMLSVKGVGSQMATNILIYSNGFTKFKTARQFAAYCGIAPFPFTSGSSVRGRKRVNHLANKKLKALLSLCAVSAIQYSPEMKKYFEKRVAEGKNKLSVVNIIRNKIIHRIFAVVKRGTPYVELIQY